MPHSTKPAILLVDDEADARLLIRMHLESAGYPVQEADSGRKALELLATSDPPIELLITDVLMPQMHGNELLKHARSYRPNLKALFISGHPETILGTLALVPEKAHFLQKPVKPERLLPLVESLLAALLPKPT